MGTIITIKEAAERLRVSVPLVYKLCSEGKLACIRFGTGRGTLRILEEDLAAFIEASKDNAHRLTNAAGLKHIKVRSPVGSP